MGLTPERIKEALERDLKFRDVVKKFNEINDPLGSVEAHSVAICIRKDFKPDGSYNTLSDVRFAVGARLPPVRGRGGGRGGGRGRGEVRVRNERREA